MSLTKADKEEIKAMIDAAIGGLKDEEESQVWGDGVEWLTLKNGLKIALEDYWEIDKDGNKKTEFTQDEAIAIEKKTNGKYRIPTMVEWAQIVEELAIDGIGCINPERFVDKLKMTKDDTGWGHYWSSTISAASNGYNLGFNATAMYPADSNYRLNGFPVRCLMEEEK